MGRPIGAPLLAQGYVMIAMQVISRSFSHNIFQLILVWFCVRYHPDSMIVKSYTSFASFFKDFWNWNGFSYYIISTVVIALCSTAIMYPLQEIAILVEFIGFASLIIESSLGIPQVHLYKL